MSAARIFTPENRLAKILLTLDAPNADDLVTEAEVRVGRMSEAIRGYVASKLEEVMRYATQGEDVLFAECRTLGAAALNVAEVAGAARLETIGEIARGISAMVDNLITSGIWHTDALRLHLDTLALVNQGDGGRTPANDQILARLRNMREAVGIME
jgi:hypothetical protein